MAAYGHPFRFGPVALSATLTTNILNPGTTTGGVNCTSAPFDKLKLIIRHLHILNKTASAATFSLYIGATGANAAGTEFWGVGKSVPANDCVDWYGELELSQADFMVGGSGTTLSLVLNGEGWLVVGA